MVGRCPGTAAGLKTYVLCTEDKRMPRFYIEIPHESDKISCLKAIKVLKETGSHFLTNAEYGCLDGDHSARLIIELENKEEALMVVPRAYRENARVITLSSFDLEKVDRALELHSGQES
jgi:hypothetical protein